MRTWSYWHDCGNWKRVWMPFFYFYLLINVWICGGFFECCSVSGFMLLRAAIWSDLDCNGRQILFSFNLQLCMMILYVLGASLPNDNLKKGNVVGFLPVSLWLWHWSNGGNCDMIMYYKFLFLFSPSGFSNPQEDDILNLGWVLMDYWYCIIWKINGTVVKPQLKQGSHWNLSASITHESMTIIHCCVVWKVGFKVLGLFGKMRTMPRTVAELF